MNPKKKRRLQIGLDILLTFSLMTLFSKSFFGLYYHEVVGLLVLGPIIIHIGINISAVRGMKKNFTRVPASVRACLIVDLMLMALFFWMGVSGVLISKKILTFISSSSRVFKVWHMVLGGLSVLLLGIHVGLHLCRRDLGRMAAVMTVFALGAGIYGFTASSMGRWVSMPFSAAEGGHGNYEGAAPVQGIEAGGESAAPMEMPQGEQMNGAGMGEAKRANTWPERCLISLQYLGMMLFAAMSVYWTVRLKKLRKHPISVRKTAQPC